MSSAVKEVRVRFASQSVDADTLVLPTDGARSDARLQATLTKPAVTRDALLTLADVVASDMRFKARDRSDYLEYLLKQGRRANNDLWKAQKAFLEAKYGGVEAEAEVPLDPIVTVSSRGVSIEAFSADESSYARLFLRAPESFQSNELRPGTTYLHLTPELVRTMERVRSYRECRMALAPAEGAEDAVRKVSYRWIRAFGQVQAASTLPSSQFEISPVDLYNVLLTLRTRRATHSPRALRYELVPGEVPRLVLEPWDLVLSGTGEAYDGPRPVVVRTWGRKRLAVLSRLLPHARRITVHLVGAGLPAYYVVDLAEATLTLALSGWTDSGWAGIATFDLLAAGRIDDEMLPRQLVKRLADDGPQSFEDLVAASGRAPQDVRTALMSELLRGNVLHDVQHARFWARPMFAEPVDVERLRYRDDREAQAHRLLEVDGQVRLTRVHDLGKDGVRIEGEVEDPSAHRTYKTSFTLDREGRTVDATCTSPQFKRSGLKEGPTVPMIALRLRYARQQAELEAARGSEAGRQLIRAETRTLIRRDDQSAELYRVSLDGREVVVRWGPHPDEMRMQRLFFATADDAKADYFGRLGALAQRGFIDASAA